VAFDARWSVKDVVDQKVREATTSDLDTSFFIEAGAGTGKTTILVGRVLEIIRSGRGEIGQIVCLTFTEKAAAELRDRIREELHRELASGDADQRFGRALNDLDASHVETIHAFASSILREHPLQSGIDPNFIQLDDTSSDVDFDDRWENWMWTDDPEVSGVLRRSLELGLRIQEDLRGVAKNFTAHREVEPQLAQSTQLDTEAVLNRLKTLVDDSADIAAHCTNETDGSMAKLREVASELETVLDLEDDEREGALFKVTLRPIMGGKANWTNLDARESMFLQLGAISLVLEGFKDDVRRSLTSDAARILWAFAKDTAYQRIREGLLTFDDLLIEAGRLIREETDVRQRLQRRYRFFLIDEFQDTDPIQAEMIFRLSAISPSENQAERWSDLDVVPGRLFLVGDPKQSIYRFRRADIAIYMTAKEAFSRMARQSKGARVVSLVQNFRSVPKIVDWVNSVFERTITPAEGLFGAQATYEPIHAARPEVGRGVVHLYPASPLEEERLPAIRREEARAIAKMIQALVARHEDTVERNEYGPLNVSFRDICVLVDTRTALDTYTQELTSKGIPFVTDAGNLFLRQEIRDVAALLRTLDDPSDTASLVAGLKSEAFSCSDEELLRFKVSGGFFNLFTPIIAGDPVSDALQRLRSLYAAKSRLGLAPFVDRVIRESFLVESLLLSVEERQRAANLKLIVQRARDFSENGMDSLRPFIRWLSSRQNLRPRESESQLAENDDDVVRVMTIHGAKGLEFPVVFLAKMAGGLWDEQPQYVVNRNLGLLEFRVGTKNNRFSTPGFETAWEQEKRFMEAEEDRKLYVAATRACDYLIVPMYRPDANPGKHRYLPMLPPRSAVQTQNPPPTIAGATVMMDNKIPVRAIQPQVAGVPGADLSARWIKRHQTIGALAIQGPRFVIPSELGHDLSKQPQETEPLDWDEPEFDRGLESDGQKSPGMGRGALATALHSSRFARERGVLVHEALFRIDFAHPEKAMETVRWICTQRGALNLLDEVSGHVQRVILSRGMDRVRRASRVLKEIPVATFDGATYVEGIVDLLFQEPDGWVVADYKTDALEAGRVDKLVERYRPQVEAYASALAATRISIKETALWFTQSGELVQI
jgi:ATP-dependent helicase/nuclease subunit A